MTRVSVAAIGVVVLGGCGQGGGVEGRTSSTEQGPATVSRSEVHHLTSSEVAGQEYRIQVALPASYGSDPGRHYPVFYVLDADMLFGTAVDVSRALALGQELPEVIVVGVGYPVEAFVETVGVRVRDFTPTADSAWMAERFARGNLPGMPPPAGTGGGDAFLRFLSTELVPFVERRYLTTPGDRGLFGHSHGALFALHAFLAQPDLFRRYVVSSPSLWWDGGELLGRIAHAERGPGVAARIYLSVGSEEQSTPADERLRMIDNVQTVRTALERPGWEEVHVEGGVLDGESHLSVPTAALSRGLRSVYLVQRPGR